MSSWFSGMAIPSSRNRVPAHTAGEINQRIRNETERRVAEAAAAPRLLVQRLSDLDEEWDIERAIEANAAIIALIGVGLGYFAHPYWLILPALVAAFLLQHSIQGWCPPVPILRRFGFRTVYEIDQEKMALKAIRGDFDGLPQSGNVAAAALEASGR